MFTAIVLTHNESMHIVRAIDSIRNMVQKTTILSILQLTQRQKKKFDALGTFQPVRG